MCCLLVSVNTSTSTSVSSSENFITAKSNKPNQKKNVKRNNHILWPFFTPILVHITTVDTFIFIHSECFNFLCRTCINKMKFKCECVKRFVWNAMASPRRKKNQTAQDLRDQMQCHCDEPKKTKTRNGTFKRLQSKNINLMYAVPSCR